MKPKRTGGEAKGRHWWQRPREKLAKPQGRGGWGLFPLRLRASSRQLAGLWGTGGWQAMTTHPHTPPPCLPKNLKAALAPRVYNFVYSCVPHSEKSLGPLPIAPFPSPTRTPVFFLHRAYLCLRQVPPAGTCAYVSLGYSSGDLGAKRLFRLLSDTNVHLVELCLGAKGWTG